MMKGFKLILFVMILISLFKIGLQTKSKKVLFILLTGICVIACQLGLKQLDSSLWQNIIGSLTVVFCLISGYFIIKNEKIK